MPFNGSTPRFCNRRSKLFEFALTLRDGLNHKAGVAGLGDCVSQSRNFRCDLLLSGLRRRNLVNDAPFAFAKFGRKLLDYVVDDISGEDLALKLSKEVVLNRFLRDSEAIRARPPIVMLGTAILLVGCVATFPSNDDHVCTAHAAFQES